MELDLLDGIESDIARVHNVRITPPSNAPPGFEPPHAALTEPRALLSCFPPGRAVSRTLADDPERGRGRRLLDL